MADNAFAEFDLLPQSAKEENAFAEFSLIPADLPDETVFFPEFNGSAVVSPLATNIEIERAGLLGPGQVPPSHVFGATEVQPIVESGAFKRLFRGVGAFFPESFFGTIGIALQALGTEIETTRTVHVVDLDEASRGQFVITKKEAFKTDPKAALFELIKIGLRKTTGPRIFKDSGEEIVIRTTRWLIRNGLVAEGEDDFVFMIGHGGMSSVAALGMLVTTKSPTATAMVFGGIQASSIYQELVDKVGHEGATDFALLGGAAEAGLELIGGHTFLEIAFKPGSRLGKASLSFAVEAVQEGTQTGAESALLFKLREDDLTAIFKNIAISMAIGGVVGTGASVSISTVQALMVEQRPDLAAIMKKNPEAAEQEARRIAAKFDELTASGEINVDEIIDEVAKAAALELAIRDSDKADPKAKQEVLDILNKFINFEEITTPESRRIEQDRQVKALIEKARARHTATEDEIAAGRTEGDPDILTSERPLTQSPPGGGQRRTVGDAEHAFTNVTYETIPSPDLGLEVRRASTDVQAKFAREAAGIIFDENGRNSLADLLGVEVLWNYFGTGLYAGQVTPNVSTGIKETGAQDANRFARAVQYIFKQRAVPFYGTGIINGGTETLANIVVFSEPVTSEQELRLKTALEREFGEDAGYTKIDNDQIDILNFTSMDDVAFREAVDRALDGFDVAEVTEFTARAQYDPVHDWGVDSNGETLLEEAGLGRGPEAQTVRGWRQLFEGVIGRYSGEELAARERELAEERRRLADRERGRNPHADTRRDEPERGLRDEEPSEPTRGPPDS